MSERSTAPEHVVVGVDGGDSGWRALRWAAGEAAAHGAPLVIVHSTAHSPAAEVTFRSGSEPSSPVLAEATLRAGTGPEPPSVYQRHVTGHRGAALAKVARPGDLLVLGLRTRRRLAARVLGSTTSHLLSRPPCAVAVVPPPLEDQPTQGPFSGHLAAGIDGRASAQHVLPQAFVEANAHKLPLVAVHAEPRPDHPTGAYVDQRMLEVGLTPLPESLGMLEDSLAPWQRDYPDVTVRRGYFYGTAVDVLRHVCTAAALLVLGPPSRTPLPLHLADRVLSHTACPVLVSRPTDSWSAGGGSSLER